MRLQRKVGLRAVLVGLVLIVGWCLLARVIPEPQRKLVTEAEASKGTPEVGCVLTAPPLRNFPLVEGTVVLVIGPLVVLHTDGRARRGYAFDLYRGSEYVGLATANFAIPGFCSAFATIVARPIKVGDCATTQL